MLTACQCAGACSSTLRCSAHLAIDGRLATASSAQSSLESVDSTDAVTLVADLTFDTAAELKNMTKHDLSVRSSHAANVATQMRLQTPPHKLMRNTSRPARRNGAAPDALQAASSMLWQRAGSWRRPEQLHPAALAASWKGPSREVLLSGLFVMRERNVTVLHTLAPHWPGGAWVM